MVVDHWVNGCRRKPRAVLSDAQGPAPAFRTEEWPLNLTQAEARRRWAEGATLAELARSARRAEKRSALRLEPPPAALQSVCRPAGCSREKLRAGEGCPLRPLCLSPVSVSPPLARLSRLVATAQPPRRIEPARHAPAKRRMRPIRRVLHDTMLHRVKMRVVHVGGEVLIVLDRVLPIPPLPNAALATAAHDR